MLARAFSGLAIGQQSRDLRYTGRLAKLDQHEEQPLVLQ